jgi:hypothetical protein
LIQIFQFGFFLVKTKKNNKISFFVFCFYS